MVGGRWGAKVNRQVSYSRNKHFHLEHNNRTNISTVDVDANYVRLIFM